VTLARATTGVLAALWLVASAASATAAEPAGGASAETTGKRLYLERCAPCHGDGGAGDGPAAAAIDPKPQNFRDAAFWKGRTTAQLRQAVRAGKPGTLMAPFEGVLSDEEIDAVVGYLAHFRPTVGTGAGPGDGEVSLARRSEDAVGGTDRGGGGMPAVRGVHP
jgi:mono/diheme cytochrome c family protein